MAIPWEADKCKEQVKFNSLNLTRVFKDSYLFSPVTTDLKKETTIKW